MGKYGRQDYDEAAPFADIPDHEPVFVIRGQDPAAPDTLRFYARRASQAGAARALVLSVERHATAIELFQQKHGTKVPDIK